MKNKRVLITGATKGIGREMAKKFADSGYNIIINYRDEKEAIKLEEELLEKNVEVLKIKADISNYKECENMFLEIKEKWKGLDILVNNAGITKDNIILRMTKEDFDSVIDVNLKGSFYCMKFASKLMLKNKFGRIISIASVVGIHGNIGQINYAASKAGVIAMTKSLAKELARKNITVNAVSPGFIESNMTEDLKLEYKEELLNRIAVNRFGHASDIANLVLFLAREDSSYITGQNMVVDGGLFL